MAIRKYYEERAMGRTRVKWVEIECEGNLRGRGIKAVKEKICWV